ncbi:hypothetical protein [Conexibacter sp. SYSU D00693]|uniref:hypothetical protein n=1 Tax=Conexibacter sp. SYSU D00693 TaxID=2812560 RepID=UPI00196B10FD|nr:hypothetical protein [Conexibacter sp. SYSU D00693]
MHVGVADHLGWAVVVNASADGEVVDRRRISLVEPGVEAMPVHRASSRALDDGALGELVAAVRASAVRATTAALADLAAVLPAPIATFAVRDWPRGFPAAIAEQRRAPHEAWADGVRYRQVLAEVAGGRGWTVSPYDAKHVLEQAALVLGARTAELLRRPREVLGPPWTKDHRVALAAALLGASARS